MPENGKLNWDEQKAAYDRGYNSASGKTSSTAEAYARNELAQAAYQACLDHLASVKDKSSFSLKGGLGAFLCRLKATVPCARRIWTTF